MNKELARVRDDVETIQRALGLASSFRGEWVQWMKRDNWFNLWWCVPGLILVVSALLPFDRASHYLGLMPDQWTGILVAAALLGIAIGHGRHVAGRDGRPEDMVRESKRMYGMTRQGFWFGVAFFVEFLVFLVWGRQHQIGFEPFWTGLFLLWGCTCLVGALSAKVSVLLGYALPFMAYGLCLPLAGDNRMIKGILFGTMFIAVAVCFSLIQVWEIRKIERSNESH